MGGISHELIKRGVLELAVDADISIDRYDDLFRFDITIGTGFSSGSGEGFVNVEIPKITLTELKEMSRRLNSIIECYEEQFDRYNNPLSSIRTMNYDQLYLNVSRAIHEKLDRENQ